MHNFEDKQWQLNRIVVKMKLALRKVVRRLSGNSK